MIGFVLFFVLGSIGLSIYLSGLVNRRLREIVHNSSQGLYRLDYGKVRVNALAGNLSIHDVELLPDTSVFGRLQQLKLRPRFLVACKAEKLQLKNLRWLGYLLNNELHIGKLLIDQPNFSITQYGQQDTARKTGSIYQLVSKQVKDLRIGLLSIRNAEANYEAIDSGGQAKTINKVEQLNIDFTRVRFEKKKAAPGMLAEDYSIALNEFRHRTTDSLYWIGISGLIYKAAQKRLKLSSFYVEPRYADSAFSKRLKMQETRYNMKLENLVADSLDLGLLAEHGKLVVPQLNIGKGTVDMYMNRGLPKPAQDQVNAAISQKISNLGFPFAIQRLRLNGIRLQYRELEPRSGRTATIRFENVAGEAANITTLPEHISRNALMAFSLRGKFLQAAVSARFEFDLNKSDGSFKTWLRASQLEADQLNPILVAVARIEARKGLLKQLEATIQGNADLARADVSMEYEGLKINLLKAEGDSLVKKGLPSMFANLFIMDDNPKDGILRRANNVVRKRGFGKSFFNMIWGSVSMGIQQIIAKKQGLKF